MFEAPSLCKLQEAIANPDNPIGMRMRAAYFLRQAYDNYVRNKINNSNSNSNNSNNTNNNTNTNTNNDDNKEEEKKMKDDEKETKEIDEIVIETLRKGLEDVKHGSLLRHEFAYVMGQIRDERSCSTLEKILLNKSDCIMVRHECGEALGAISSTKSIPTLQQAITESPNTPEISETCSLAISFIQWKINGGVEGDEDQPMVCACMLNPYSSVDPAPPHPNHVHLSTEDIGCILHNTENPLFERYRAMFSLRNRGDGECVSQLGYALINDNSSALLRHEIAYVLGQIQSADSIDVLRQSLERINEHVMVRHESAEALGAIEERWDEVEATLNLFLQDDDIVVRESCVVALDAADYWGRTQVHEVQADDCVNDSNGDEDKDKIECNIEENVQHNLTFAQQKAL